MFRKIRISEDENPGFDIEMMEFKDVYYKVKTTEDLYTQLEDNQVQLSTMKASRFYMVFEERITYWEKALNHLSEVIEMLLAVQRYDVTWVCGKDSRAAPVASPSVHSKLS